MRNLRCLRDIELEVPIKTAANINEGALIMPGVTAETDLGTAILSDATSTDVIGLMAGPYDYSERGACTVKTTLAWAFAEIKPITNAQVIRGQIDLTDTMALASDESSKTITITSLEDNIDTSFLYCVSGTGIGQLRYVDTSASGSCTIYAAGSPEWDTADTCVKIPRIFHGLLKPTTTMDKLGTDAAAGTMRVLVIATWIERAGTLQRLNPINHYNLSGLNATATNVKFFVDYIAINNAFYPVD